MLSALISPLPSLRSELEQREIFSDELTREYALHRGVPGRSQPSNTPLKLPKPALTSSEGLARHIPRMATTNKGLAALIEQE
jgi:hypothetical protein